MHKTRSTTKGHVQTAQSSRNAVNNKPNVSLGNSVSRSVPSKSRRMVQTSSSHAMHTSIVSNNGIVGTSSQHANSPQSIRKQKVLSTQKRLNSNQPRDAEYTPIDNADTSQNQNHFDPQELERLIKSMQANSDNADPYDIARTDPGKWQETPTPDGWMPGPDDPTYVGRDAPQLKDTRPDIHAEQHTEVKRGESKKHSFQTETRQMLDIVTNSLYTDKEVFLRELVSNASDALEKARYLSTKEQLANPDIPLEVRIFADEANKRITIQDTGVGMSESDLISHLGTIARSGSKQWVKDVKEGKDNIIGQFGVGFYSGFMVADKIDVYSKSGKLDENKQPVDPTGHFWTSDGSGEYELAEADGVERGTKIVLNLRDQSAHFAARQTLENILKKYSNFVGYPIYLNGLRVNTVQAIWNMQQNQVTEEQHAEFYRYLANAYDAPTYRLHFNADVPIQINALFYFPERHMEKYGMGRMDPGTSLYSRKVLIKPKAQGLLPDYFRFVQGVVDSEDIPLNISRENMQDSLLISRISSVLTKRIIKHLQDQAKKDPAKYTKWFNEFGVFIREGICSDFTYKNELARLLRFDSSHPDVTPDMPTSLDDYIARMPTEQQNIYFLCAPNRKSALASPYYESLKNSGYEVLFMYHPLDDFVVQTLRDYNRRKLVSAESNEVETNSNQEQRQKQLETEYSELAEWVKTSLNDKITTLTLTDQVSSYPAFIVDHESASTRKMLKMMDTQGLFGENNMPVQKQKLHVNPKHPIFVKLDAIRNAQPEVAKTVLDQIFDNAMVAADLLDNPRDMLPRMNKLMELALDPVLVQEYEKKTSGKQ